MMLKRSAPIVLGMMSLFLQAVPASAQSSVGVAAAVKGGVEASAPGAAVRTLQSGMPVFLGDRITTDEKGHVQIILQDETVFTIGASSAIEMDEFIYDPSTGTGKVGAEVVKGVFRFVSGKVARNNPKNMEVKLPVGNVGIRGTIAGGRVEGMKSLVVLLGPGAKNNTGNKPGSIEVSNQIKDKISKVKVDRTGFGTTIEGPDSGPSRPKLVPLDQMTTLTNALQPPAEKEEAEDATPAEGEGTASEEAGQALFEALAELENSEETGDLAEQADDAIQSAAQNATQIGKVADGVSTFDDLRQIESGLFHFNQDPVSLSTGGSYAFHFNINFANRTIGGSQDGPSHITGTDATIDGGDQFNFDIPSTSFDGSGSASFHFDITDNYGGTQTATADLDFSINNRNGIVADNASHTVVINGASTGSSSNMSRLPGPGPTD